MPSRRIPSLSIVIVLLGTLAGCAPKLPPEQPWEKDARALLDQAEAFYGKRQYDQAAKTVDAFFSRYPKSRSMDRALYLKGDIRLTLRDYPQALSYYKEIIEKFPASPLIPDAKYKLGICYFEVKEYDLAVANLEDRGKITDPAKLRRATDMLAAAYVIKKQYPLAVKEYVALANTVSDGKQRAGYQDRVREIIDRNLTEDELGNIAEGSSYPADLATLRLAGLLIKQRKYREALKIARDFTEHFPGHPEKTRADLLASEATAMLSAPRYFVAALVPQSGQLAFYGDKVLRGIQLAVHAYNLQDPDNRVEVIAKDTEGSPEKAAASLAELASKGIVAVVGPVTSDEVAALGSTLDTVKIPAITPAASRPGLTEKSPWIFRNALTNDAQVATAAQYALSQKLRRFVIMYPDDAYGKDLARLFTKELTKKAELLATVAYPDETNDFGPFIRRIVEIDLRSRKIPIPEEDDARKKLFAEYVPGFDAMYLPGYADKVGLLIPQLAFYNISTAQLIGSNNWHSPELLERGGRHVEGAVFVDGFFPESIDHAVKAFADGYRSAYQEEPDILAAQAYDAASMILSLVKQRRDTPQAIRDGLLSLKEYPGVSGLTTFAGTGEAQKKLFLIKVEDGRFALMNW